VYSPRDKRGKSVSRNRRLGIGIRADNGRFHSVSVYHVTSVGLLVSVAQEVALELNPVFVVD